MTEQKLTKQAKNGSQDAKYSQSSFFRDEPPHHRHFIMA
jgi:hypothetical protein